VDKSLLGAVKDSIVQGFQWATREGPLCDERKLMIRIGIFLHLTFCIYISSPYFYNPVSQFWSF